MVTTDLSSEVVEQMRCRFIVYLGCIASLYMHYVLETTKESGSGHILQMQ